MIRSIALRLALAACLVTLAACAVTPATAPEIARYDLGAPQRVRAPLPLAAIAVAAPAWLDTTALWYRLDYDDALERHAYAQSRWVAPLPALVERHLQRRLLAEPVAPAGGCRLTLTLDELEQRFAMPATSAVVLEARLRLFAPTGGPELARHSVSLSQAAARPDARGGVAAARAVVDALADEITHWLATLAAQRPELVRRCAPPLEK